MAERAPRRCQALCCELACLSSLGLPSSLWGRGWKLRYSRSNFSERRNWDLHVVGTGTFTSEPWERGRLGLRWRGGARAAQFSLSLPRRPQGSHPASFYWAPQAHTCLPSALFVLPGFSPCTPLAQPPKPHPQVGQSLLGCPAPLSFCPIRRTHPQPACLPLHHSWV